MKKFSVICVFILSLFLFTGCTSKGVILDNMSDLRMNIFDGENSGCYAQYTSGYREEPFNYDGISRTKKVFGVIMVDFTKPISSLTVNCTASYDDKVINVLLEKSPIDSSFMADIETAIPEDKTITINFVSITLEKVELVCKSKDFSINYTKAIEIAETDLKQDINKYVTGRSLNAECYLKILTNRQNGFKDYFWFFSIIGRDGTSKKLVIDVNTGAILVKS